MHNRPSMRRTFRGDNVSAGMVLKAEVGIGPEVERMVPAATSVVCPNAGHAAGATGTGKTPDRKPALATGCREPAREGVQAVTELALSPGISARFAVRFS